jgi:tRNA dimethylallyltransferase
MYIIGGPTASGKSKLAIQLAQLVDGEIVNADSLQLYKNIPILSAAPSDEELSQAAHHLFGIYHDDQVSTVHVWARLAKDAVENIKKRRKVPIIVGGTGMYLKSITHGLSEIPEISVDVRNTVRQMQQMLNAEDFYQEVITKDTLIKEALHANDKQRLGRALEVFLETGQSIKTFQGNAKSIIDGDYKYIVVSPDQSDLHRLIEVRSSKMLENGALQEVQNLRSKGVTLDMPICKAIGVKEIWQYLDGAITKNDMLMAFNQTTRQYAKRQVTWFKNQVDNATIVENPFDTDHLKMIIQEFTYLPDSA